MPSRRRPTENSSTGLSLLSGGHRVVVTGEEHHQDALRPYAPAGPGQPRSVAVELAFASPTRRGHTGRRGLEVRLDGQRVGELTPLMAQRYGPIVEDVVRRGARPGCRASVTSGRRGIQVELLLPDAADLVAHPPPVASPTPGTRTDATPSTGASSGGSAPTGARPRATPTGAHPDGARPAAARPPGSPVSSRRRRWIGAGAASVVTLLIVAASVGGRGAADPPVAAPPGPATSTTSTAPPSTTTSAASATSPAPVSTAPATARSTTRRPTSTAAPEPPPVVEPRTTKPTTKPTTTRKPKPTAESSGGCHPNYGGCVPVASDVDCSGGSGNGPEYVDGPVSVNGTDVYRLDSDDDGTACEA